MFDGASNAMGHGIGAVLTSPRNTHIPFTARLCFDCTNNVAEYEACVMGLEAAIDLKIKILEVYGDSALVIHQVRGDWDTRHPNLVPYRDYIIELLPAFDEVTFEHIPREANQLEDALATLAAMFKVNYPNHAPSIRICHYKEPTHIFPAHYLTTEDVSDERPWYFDIKRYLEKQEYLEGATICDKRTLRRLASKFLLLEDVLHKRNYDSVLLRCVGRHEA